MNVLEKVFHIKERQSSLKMEIIGGLCTFVAMCYILPINSSIMSDAGMNSSGVFIITALLSCLVTIIMGLVANYPVVLSAGMGLNAFLAYTIIVEQGLSWQDGMILLTVSGIIFFVISLTPIRRKIIDAIPMDIKLIISASLGAFICFVGLKNSMVITSSSSTYVTLNSFLDPAVLISVIGILICFGLMFVGNKTVKTLAIPITIAGVAIVGLIISTIMIENNSIINVDGQWVYNMGEVLNGPCKLPIWPAYDSSVKFADFSGVKDVFLYGIFSDQEYDFAQGLVDVFTNPVSYIGIFSLIIVNMFDTTATLLAVGRDINLIDKDGKMKNFQRAVIADATGALICGPLGTSAVTSFAESSVGVSLGARTGLAAIVAALMFFLSVFIYPVFFIFTAGSVTAPALVCVGALIFVNNMKEIKWSSLIIGITAFIMVIFSVLSYSISSGIGLGLIAYCLMMLFSKKGKEVGWPIYMTASLFLISFAATAVIKLVN